MDKIDQAIHQVVALREKRKALQVEVDARAARLMSFMLDNHVFETTPEGKLRYETDAHTISIRNGYDMRQFHTTSEPGLLDAIKNASSKAKGHTAHEILLMASGISKSRIELQERHGRLTERQIAALYSIAPEMKLKVLVTTTGSLTADAVNELLEDE